MKKNYAILQMDIIGDTLESFMPWALLFFSKKTFWSKEVTEGHTFFQNRNAATMEKIYFVEKKINVF